MRGSRPLTRRNTDFPKEVPDWKGYRAPPKTFDAPSEMLPARALSRFFELSPAAPKASPSLGWSAMLISKPQTADDSAKEHVLWRSLSISVWN